MVEIRDLSKKYEENTVLDGFSHKFGNCGITCLIGDSGSGKSTLFNLIAGFDRDYCGKIFVENKNIAELSQIELSDYRKQCIGFIFQEYNLLEGYTALENILIASELNIDNEKKNKEVAMEILNRLSIAEKTNEKIEDLSGGQKQRVAIARALVGKPTLILADEPTGALDRNMSNEIMEILAEISLEIPVFIITHDEKITKFADEVITIEDGKCKVIRELKNIVKTNNVRNQSLRAVSTPIFKRALRNFKVNFKRFYGISLAISIIICAVLISFSAQNIVQDKVHSFEQKNTAFAWGQLPYSEEAFSLMRQLDEINQYYFQYEIPNSYIVFFNKQILIPQKSFDGIARESMNIGVMPRNAEIAITPSLAKQFKEDIRTLTGKEIIFFCGRFSKKLKISGIFNGNFDDYYLDANTEKELYKALQIKKSPISIAYEVNGFNQVIDAEKIFIESGITPITASKQVSSLKTTFEKLKILFIGVSVLIGASSMFICSILLIKLASMRIHEIGLLIALGYRANQIKMMLFYENLIMAILSVISTVFILTLFVFVSNKLYLKIIITSIQFIFSFLGTGVLVWIITFFYNMKLLKTDPAMALRK